MCKKCKYCGKSNLGVTITQTSKIKAKMLDGKITECFKDTEVNNQTIQVNYCYTCDKEITDADIIEELVCKSCGKVVSSVNEDGLCEDCAKAKQEAEEEAKKIANMSHEELIKMLMQKKLNNDTNVKASTDKIVVNDTVDTKADVDTNKTDDTKDTEDKTKTKRKRRTKVNKEPAEIKDTEVKEAEDHISKTLESTENPKAADNDKVNKNNDQDIKVDTDSSIPDLEVDDEDSILKALDDVDLDIDEDNLPAKDGFPF